MALIFRNKLYAINPKPVRHNPIKNLVVGLNKAFKPVGRNEKVIRWKSAKTGLFITKGRAAQLHGINAYWNTIRAIVRTGETRTFSEAQSLFKDFQQTWEKNPDSVDADLREEVFGSP